MSPDFFMLYFDERGPDKIHRIQQHGPIPCNLLNFVAGRVREWPGVDADSLRAVPLDKHRQEQPHFRRYHVALLHEEQDAESPQA